MFITNHGSSEQPGLESLGNPGAAGVPPGLGDAHGGGRGCQPTRSTYSGVWYDFGMSSRLDQKGHCLCHRTRSFRALPCHPHTILCAIRQANIYQAWVLRPWQPSA